MSHQVQAAESEKQPLALPPGKRQRWKLALLGIVILLCGMVIGAGITILSWHKMVSYTFQHHEQMHERAMARIQRRLDLSDTQAEEVERIHDKRMGTVHEIWREAYIRSHQQIMLMQDEVSDVLDERQLQKWQRRVRRYEHVFPALPPPPEDNKKE